MGKKLICLIICLTIILLIAGCKENNSAENSKPLNYQKVTISQQAEIKHAERLKVNSKGQLIISNSTSSSPEYVTIDSESNKSDSIQCDFKGKAHVFTLDLNDNLYIALQNTLYDDKTNEPNEMTVTIYKLNPSGKVLKTIDVEKIPAQSIRESQVTNITVDKDENIYLLRAGGSISIIDNSGRNIKTLNSSIYTDMDIDNKGNLLVCGESGSQGKPFIQKLKIPEGRSLWERPVESNPLLIRYNRFEKYIYTYGNSGIIKYNDSGKEVQTLIDKNKYTLPYFVFNAETDADGNIYILASDGGSGSFIFKYMPTEKDPDLEPDKKLSISLSGIINRFKEKNPDFVVETKMYVGEEIARLATEIMAGKGPDIIDATRLPYAKYIDKGIFVNLSEIMDRDETFNIEDYYTKAIDSCKYKNSLYYMPIGLTVHVLCADKTILDKENINIDDDTWTLDTLMEIAQKVTKDTDDDGKMDRYAFFKENVILLHYMILSKYPDLITYTESSSSFNTEEFMNFITSLKSLYDMEVWHPVINYQAFAAKNNNDIVFYPAGIFSLGILKLIKNEFNSEDISILKFSTEYRKNSVTGGVHFALAINSKSKYIDKAWELIKMISSDEYHARNGFSFNKKAYTKFVPEKIEYFRESSGIKLKDSEIDNIHQIIVDMDRIVIADPKIYDIIREEITLLLNGDKTSQQVVETVEHKMNMYLNE